MLQRQIKTKIPIQNIYFQKYNTNTLNIPYIKNPLFTLNLA